MVTRLSIGRNSELSLFRAVAKPPAPRGFVSGFANIAPPPITNYGLVTSRSSTGTRDCSMEMEIVFVPFCDCSWRANVQTC